MGSVNDILEPHDNKEQPEQHSQPEQPDQQDLKQEQQSQPDEVPSPVTAAAMGKKHQKGVKKATHKKLLSEVKLTRLKERHDRRGIVYISR